MAGSYPTGSSSVQSFSFIDGSTNLVDGSEIGSEQGEGTAPAAIFQNKLRLTGVGFTNSIGSFKLPEIDPNSVITAFDLKFTVVMNRPSGADAGEGWSINFGAIPEDHGTGEGGFAPLPKGLSIAFDTLDNGGDATSIEVFVSGVSVVNFPRTFLFDATARTVLIHWDAAAGLSINYGNSIVCTNRAVPGFFPGTGDRFAFTARTTSTGMDVLLDDLRATTTALPVLDTGGPVISEFVANNSEFEDEFGDKPGWVELLNGTPAPINLEGWYLTDSKTDLKKWRIGALTITPYSYQVVFASGRDRQLSATSLLHANFTLSKGGGYVALVRPDGTIASEYEYALQEKNVSYGEKGPERKRGYMYPASPGTVNTREPARMSLTPEVKFSHPGGLVTGPVTVALDVPTAPDAEIHYTLDRTEPTLNSPAYSGPIIVSQLTMVRARAWQPEHLPGVITSRTFVRIDDSLVNFNNSGRVFNSNLPLIFIDSFGVNVDGSTGGSRPFRPSYAVVISPDPITGRASLTNTPDYAGPAGTHVRGESSAGFDQRSYAFELWDEAGHDTDAGLVGMPADSDWVLYGPWSEKTLMRNKLIFDWMLALRGEDGTAMRSRFVELFFNQTKPGSGLAGYGSYRGIYVLMEKIKRGKDRVPLESLNSKTVDPELITGGYIIRKDKDDALKNNWTTPRTGIPLQSFDPDRFNTPQLNYIKNYLSAFETALNGANSRNFTSGYQAYIDRDTFIDAQWMLEIAKQVDGYVFSTYWHKDRGGRLRAGPLWDFNISLGNADYGTGDTPTGWLYGNSNGAGQLWYPRLHADPDYKLAHWDRYWQMRTTLLSTEAVMGAIDHNMTYLLDGYSGAVSNRAPSQIQNPVARHFRRWPRLGLRDWPNPPAETSIKTWQAEVAYMTNWLFRRLDWLDDQSLRNGRNVFRPPVLSHRGGPISAPVDVTVTPYNRVDAATTFPQGDIYYTLDNSDPRLPSGGISPAALKYSGPLSIESAMTLSARLYYQNQWSPLASSTFFFNAVPAGRSNLVISEIMYNPAPLTAAEQGAGLVDSQNLEFLEFRNTAKTAIDLSGVRMVKGGDFNFNFMPVASRLLKPGESVVLVRDKRAFQIRYPEVPVRKIIGEFRGHLDSGGETIGFAAADGAIIQQFRFENRVPWPDGGGPGYSIVLRDASASPSDASAWVLSARANGTPGVSGTGADTFTGDPARDSDGDGVSDLFEFASGTDPENPDSDYIPQGHVANINVDGTAGAYFVIEFQRRPDVKNAAFVLDQSNNLKDWSSANGALILIDSETNSDGTITETYRAAAPVPLGLGASSFYRVRVELK